MRFSGIQIANVVSWVVLLGLIPMVFVMVAILGPFGLIMLGVATLFICTSINLYDDVPNANATVLKARFARRGSPEQRAALQADKQMRLSPLGFYRWCGIALLAAGIAGFIWQHVQ